jgi:hypothetical protein
MTVCTQHATRWSRCDLWRAYQERAYEEWSEAEELEDVRAAWGRFGGRVTVHRYGREHYGRIARLRRDA